MAGTKISDLAALTTIDDADLMALVDVDDTTMAPTGTNKKATKSAVADFMVANKLGRVVMSTAQLNAAIDEASVRGGIDLQPGAYAITTPGLVIPDGFTLSGQRGVTFLFPDTTGWDVMLIDGTEGAAVAFGANQTAGSYTVALPTGEGANFAVDDIIGLISDTIVSGTDGRARELHHVVAKSTDTLTLDAPLVHTYLTADSAEFFKVTPRTDITISDITLEWTTGGSGTNDLRGPMIRRGVRCRFEGITSLNGPGVTLWDSIGCSVIESVVDGAIHYADSRGYGVTIGGSGRGSRVIGGDFRNLRHAVTTLYAQDAGGTTFWTGPFDTVFSGLTGCGGPSSFALFDTHAHAYDTVFQSCIGRGPGQAGAPGFQDRGHRTAIKDCKSNGAKDRGITLASESVDATVANCEVEVLATASGVGIAIIGTGARVTDCRIRVPQPPSGTEYGVTIANSATNAVVEGCDFNLIGTNSTGIGDQSSGDVGQRSVRNTFRCASGTIGILGLRGSSEDDTWLGSTTAPFFTINSTARRAHRVGAPQTVTFASSYTPTPTFIDSPSITQTANITINAPSANATIKGQRLRLILIQDGTGGWTITLNAVYKANWTPNTAANKTNIIEFVCDGTNWLQVAAEVGL